MDFTTEYRNILKERVLIEDTQQNEIPGVMEEFCERETELCTRDINETINFLKTECTGDEFVWMSEVFADIANKAKSREFIQCLYDLAKKYPKDTKEYNMMDFIEEADMITESEESEIKYCYTSELTPDDLP